MLSLPNVIIISLGITSVVPLPNAISISLGIVSDFSVYPKMLIFHVTYL